MGTKILKEQLDDRAMFLKKVWEAFWDWVLEVIEKLKG